jgi:hypothetical protein
LTAQLTSCAEFLLLSRQRCRANNIPMSYQYTDQTDIRYGIFDDLFFNFRDLHRQFRRPNLYGPVTFKIPTTALFQAVAQGGFGVSVTTAYLPHQWKDHDTVPDRWVTVESDALDANHLDLVIRHGSVDLRIVGEIIIDEIPARPLFFPQISAMFRNCLNAFNLTIPITARNCQVMGCTCPVHATVAGGPGKYRPGRWGTLFGAFTDVA